MNHPLYVHNTITRKKEQFVPINAPFVGMYVCGPTLYGDAHLGHARPYITFDLLQRYMKYLGYKVRYVRNITDVGHLVNDADEGEDKIAKQARIEQLEPMEVVQHYTVRFHKNMAQLNNEPPSIEPRAAGHILEQIEAVTKIIDAGYAYEVNGSVYFDVLKYNEDFKYGKLSGRVLDELVEGTRDLDGQDEKRNSADFALWKKANPEHIMRWNSPWGEGFPGWHIECTVMSTKYLGEHFDIHGGGMDLLFPHHEAEIAQNNACYHKEPAKYWMHNNMVTINGQKMGKSLGNFITLDQFFSGNHSVLTAAYSPMAIRFFILQAHYRSTLDFSNAALEAAGKGLQRLMAAYKTIDEIKPSATSSYDVKKLETASFEALNDDMNSPIVIAEWFDAVRAINSAKAGTETFTADDIAALKNLYETIIFNILGLKEENIGSEEGSEVMDGLMQIIIEQRKTARANKDYASSDFIRDQLAKLSIEIKDGKDKTDWTFTNN
jgi:cysteinyl-tRNA synthetase